MKNFINLSDIKEDDLRKIIANAKSKKLKKNLNNKDKALINKTLIMIFEKPSTRTRISFELAMKRLGGNSIILNPEQIHYGRGNENIHDTAKVLSQYGDIIMMRAKKHKHFLDLEHILNPGDLLILNDTRVIPARLLLEKETGGKVEILFNNNKS